MAAQSGCPGGRRASIHPSVRPGGCRGLGRQRRSCWVRGAVSRLVLALPRQMWPCTVPGPPRLGLGLLGSAWALPSAAGPGNRPHCLFPRPEAGKRRGRAPAEMDEV